MRLLGALHFLVLGGEASWNDVDDALTGHAAFLREFTATQAVQTNEVQRSWALVPAFLSVADGRPLDLLELGPSAGLNLVWDRYRYRYATGTWGSSGIGLAGDDRVPPPAELLGRSVEVVRRRGVDLNPVDVTTEAGARLLQSFVWADQAERLERLRRAIDVLRESPPELIQGDYVERLPELLADRVEGAQLIVFETASTQYLQREQLDQLRTAMSAAGELVFLTTRTLRGREGYSLEAERWPGGESRQLEFFDFHGAWLEWTP